jgi:acyl carrier protein
MTNDLASHVRSLVIEECAEALVALGHELDRVPDDLDLRTAGAIDSLGFLELVASLEDRLGVTLDFEALDPQCLTVIGPLVAHVATQAQRTRSNGAVGAAL